jgi:hypothetical protein
MGIHFDAITRMQIDEIVQTAEKLLDEELLSQTGPLIQ